jgi:hypothetical protein
LNNRVYLEQLVSSKQLRYKDVSSRFDFIKNEYKDKGDLNYQGAYFKYKLELKRSAIDLLLVKFFLYKEENAKYLRKDQMSSINTIYHLFKEDPNSPLCDIMEHEFKYYGVKKEEFIRNLLLENVEQLKSYMHSQSNIHNFDISDVLLGFQNSEEQKKMNQYLINFFREKNITHKEDIIEVLCQAVGYPQHAIKHNFYTDIGLELNEKMPTNISKDIFRDKEKSINAFKNYSTFYLYFSNLL